MSLQRGVSPTPLCARCPTYSIDTHTPFLFQTKRKRVITPSSRTVFIHSHYDNLIQLDLMPNPDLRRQKSDSKAPLMTPAVPPGPRPHRRPRHLLVEMTPMAQTHQPHHLPTLLPLLHQLLFLASPSPKTIHRFLPSLSLEDPSFPVSTRQLSSVIPKSLQLSRK